jgi:hypothetical protein
MTALIELLPYKYFVATRENQVRTSTYTCQTLSNCQISSINFDVIQSVKGSQSFKEVYQFCTV